MHHGRVDELDSSFDSDHFLNVVPQAVKQSQSLSIVLWLEIGESSNVCMIKGDSVFTIQELTQHGWDSKTQHANQEHAFWHARVKSEADGRTYRVISAEAHVLCLLTPHGSECWELD